MQIRFSGVELIGRPEKIEPPPNRDNYRSSLLKSGEGYVDAYQAHFRLSDEDLAKFHDLFLSDEQDRKLIECSADKIDSGKNKQPLWSRIGIQVIAGLGRIKIWDGSGTREYYPSKIPQLEFLEQVVKKAQFPEKVDKKKGKDVQKSMAHGIRVAKSAREEGERASRI